MDSRNEECDVIRANAKLDSTNAYMEGEELYEKFAR